MAGKTKYTLKQAKEICAMVSSSSMGVKEISKHDGMPCESTIFKWLADNKEFSELYACAKKSQMDYLAEEMLDIADDATNDYMKRFNRGEDSPGWQENGDTIGRSRLRLETRKWLMGKLSAKKYGDKTQMTGADGEGPVVITQIQRTIVDPKK